MECVLLQLCKLFNRSRSSKLHKDRKEGARKGFYPIHLNTSAITLAVSLQCIYELI